MSYSGEADEDGMIPNVVIQFPPRNYYVWIDPKNWLIRHQIEAVGSIFSVSPRGNAEALEFIPNPKFDGQDVSAFQNNVLRDYRAEYYLELARAKRFPSLPSRLHAIYLLESESEALRYSNRNGSHTKGRILKEVRSVGPYLASVHDSSWIEFLRLGLSGVIDSESIDRVANSYWRGEKVEDYHKLTAFGVPWTNPAIMEVLYLGRVEFLDRSLPD